MKIVQNQKLTIANIFETHFAEYAKTHKISEQQRKAVSDIMRCQTKDCGMHQTVCTDCGVVDISYNSCRNRHCPNCQNAQKQRWMEKRKLELLPVPYFHLVFTVPHRLNPIFMANKEICYRLLFENTWKTISHFSANPQWLGAQTGCIALLHTWGQNLSFHPHIHCIMPSGGLTSDGFEWLHTHAKYFAPVRELSNYFKLEFLKALQLEYQQLNLSISKDEFETLIRELTAINWVVFVQPSFQKPDFVIDYLGNYTHKIAISNHRLIKMEDDQVFFTWKDYAHGGTQKEMQLPVMEFIRRFLEHVLPHNFYKIRHYGIFGNRYKAENIENARACLEREGKTMQTSELPTEKHENLPEGGIYMGPCKECGGATISVYHLRKFELEIQELLRQTG